MIIPELLENSAEKQLEGTMSPIEREKFVSVINAMSDEEKLMVVKSVPNEVLLNELDRRLTVAIDIINKVKGALDSPPDVE